MTRFDPYAGAVRPQRTVPLEVALTLQDQAQAALREVERLSADLANVQRRRDEDVDRARREGLSEGLAALADAADDVRRAVEAAPGDGPWADGLRRLADRLAGRIVSAGVAEVGAVGDAFDPVRHEAIGVVPGPAGAVVRVARTGLVAGDGALLRPAAVVVGDGTPVA